MTHDELRSYIRAWSRHGIFFAPASRDAAARSGLSTGETSRLFGVVCVEMLPWRSAPRSVQPPEAVAAGTADGCAVDVLVEDEALHYRFPYGHPDPARRGEVNEQYLDPYGLADRLLPLLDALGERVRLVVLRPAPVYRTEQISFGDMLGRLDRFLALLPGPYRYALEAAGPGFLRPEYFSCLRRRGVAHVFGEGDGLLRMLPPLSEQLAAPGAPASPVCVVRSRACAGVPGLPWPRPDPALRREGLRDAVRRCVAAGVPLHLFIDDEQDPVRSLGLLMEMLNHDLARQSVLRRRAA